MGKVFKKITQLSWVNPVVHFIMHQQISLGLRYGDHVLYGWTLDKKLNGHELETVEFFKKNLKPGDTVFDIGSAHGYYALLFAKLVGPKGSVVAFEPDTKSYSWVAKAIKKNGYSNVHAERLGISDYDGEAHFHMVRRGSGVSSITHKVGPNTTTISVIKLASYHLVSDWCKIDVEGAELKVLRGMGRPVRCTIELSPKNLIASGEDPLIFLQQVRSMGYRIYYILDNGDIEERADSELVSISTARGHINVFLEPVS